MVGPPFERISLPNLVEGQQRTRAIGLSHSDRSQKRNAKNTPYVDNRKAGKRFYLGDRVSRTSQIGYIAGFSGTTAYVVNEKGKWIEFVNSKGVARVQANLSELEVHHHTNGWRNFCLPTG